MKAIVIIMNNFFSRDIVVTKIHYANLVRDKVDIRVHDDRQFHGFAMILGGTNVYRFKDGHQLVVNDGSILYLPQHSSYTVDLLKRGLTYCINFSITEDVYNEPFVFTPKNASAFEKLFATADKYRTSRRVGYETKCRALLYECLCQMEIEMSLEYTNSEKFAIIAPAINYIHENYTSKPIRSAELAAICGISGEYFRKLFRLYYNTTPTAYISSMKISRAKELLKSGMYTISEAALASGYTDMSHFSREFKKATGIPPSLYGQ